MMIVELIIGVVNAGRISVIGSSDGVQEKHIYVIVA